MVKFILNHQLVSTDQSLGGTVLDFARYHKRLHGTKIGCREGDCGACTMLVGDFEDGTLVYRSATSCLMPLGNAHGKHIVTVEGINMDQLSPVQQAMVDTNGTQCGFCTLGFVMSFTGFVLHKEKKQYEEAIASIDGNICRCTGYKSIERSAAVITEKLAGKPAKETIEWLVKHQFIPGYFIDIEERLLALQASVDTGTVAANGSTAGLKLAGGTDLIVQKASTVKKSNVELLYGAPQLKGISVDGDEIHIGGSVTVTEMLESPLIQSHFREINKFIKLVSSTPIRNMATLAGNFINASPIGDMTIFYLALDASVVLTSPTGHRLVKLKNLYLGYKQLDKQPTEIVSAIIMNVPAKNQQFHFEKVSKRMYLDIASVNSACQLQLQDRVIQSIHLSAGGVAPFPKYLQQTCSYLTGKLIDEETLRTAIEIMQQEVAPISDARGTSEYKRLLLRQLFLSHFIKMTDNKVAIQNILAA